MIASASGSSSRTDSGSRCSMFSSSLKGYPPYECLPPVGTRVRRRTARAGCRRRRARRARGTGRCAPRSSSRRSPAVRAAGRGHPLLHPRSPSRSEVRRLHDVGERLVGVRAQDRLHPLLAEAREPWKFTIGTTYPGAANACGFHRKLNASPKVPTGPPWIMCTSGYFFTRRTPAGTRRTSGLRRHPPPGT